MPKGSLLLIECSSISVHHCIIQEVPIIPKQWTHKRIVTQFLTCSIFFSQYLFLQAKCLSKKLQRRSLWQLITRRHYLFLISFILIKMNCSSPLKHVTTEFIRSNNTHFNSTRYLIPMAKTERLNGLEWEQRASPVNILNQIKICHPHHLIEDSEQLPIPSEVDKCSL